MVTADEATVANLRAARGTLAGEAVRRMEEALPWYRAMSAQDRSWVGLIAHAAISAFIAWYQEPTGKVAITADVFGTAPRELTRSISLQRALEMVRTVVDSIEEQVPSIAGPGAEQHLREAVLRYSRDVAFAAAEIYARAAESRGSWDARLEALVVDAVLRGAESEDLRSRAAALNWGASTKVLVVAGAAPPAPVEESLEGLRRSTRGAGGDLLIGVQGERLVAILGHADDPGALVGDLVQFFGPGPVVVGPAVNGLMAASESARAAISGLSSARAWPGAPRPVQSEDLLPERLLTGDAEARRTLIEQAYRPLTEGAAHLLETVWTYVELGGSLEGAARALFVHPNTVRYRLRRVSDITRWDPTDARGAFVLRIAIIAGRVSDPQT
ncbi:helix-turn-helix domain-containing protein [Kineosporia rhizophila]|uniref:PucR family transcriptional regulator n=1 Tax=Kineosporia TaxID=49184 RepID=UPI001E345BE0|nr:PucR family transcriptional regulator [Kineosporia sp. NBRC 101677]MCE0538832.1 helix-turn-helix domain-containing protein [Kineosporia rhizophila]GLY18750.1 PucR family transcriptional regulator [Kineosporia sp. NBRC 101677]